jgi:drug/metabolite transporter (DMT)-like permease
VFPPILSPFIASLAYGANMVVDKIGLSKRKIPQAVYVPYVFLYLFVFSAILAPFFGAVDWSYLLNAHQDPFPLFLFLIMIALAITWNIFYYEALSKEKLSEFETITMMTPFVTIALSWIFFPERWDIHVGAAALVAAIVLIWSHWEKHHFSMDHYKLDLILAVFLMSMEDIIATNLLSYKIFTPVSLYALRTLILTGFFFAYYKPNKRPIPRATLSYISLSGFLGMIYMVLKWYGYTTLGIPFTVLITVVAPITIYTASAMVIHERLRGKVLIAATVISLAVLYATAFLK